MTKLTNFYYDVSMIKEIKKKKKQIMNPCTNYVRILNEIKNRIKRMEKFKR